MLQHRPRRRRKHAIDRGLVDLALASVVSGTYCMTWAAFQRLPWMLVPAALFLRILFFNTIYLGIYELEYHGLIDDERCNRLLDTLHGWCFDYFAPHPPAIRPWPERALAFVARSVAQFLGLQDA
eukprot:g3653.t1